MADTKQYSLRWEHHASNLVAEAECFFQDEAFLDCTLSAEGHSLQAHRLILSAASPYLATLLRVAGDKQPILIFNDMQFDVLKAIIAFIYNGKVDVPEPSVQPFLQAAQTLLLRGLSQVSVGAVKPAGTSVTSNSKVGRKSSTKRSLPPPLPQSDTAPRLQELSAPHRTEGDPFVVHSWRMTGSSETNGNPQPPGYMFKKFRLEKPAPPPDDLIEPTSSVPVKQELDLEERMEQSEVKTEPEEEEDTNFPDTPPPPGVPVPLLVCKTSLQEDDGSWPSPDLPWHQQMAEIEDLPCASCHKRYKSRYALNRHVLYECGKARKSFSCDECGKKVTRQDTLQKHKLIHLVQHMKDKETTVLRPPDV